MAGKPDPQLASRVRVQEIRLRVLVRLAVCGCRRAEGSGRSHAVLGRSKVGPSVPGFRGCFIMEVGPHDGAVQSSVSAVLHPQRLVEVF